MNAAGALEAVERIINRGGEPDEVVDAVVSALRERGFGASVRGRGKDEIGDAVTDAAEIPIVFEDVPVGSLAIGTEYTGLGARVATLIWDGRFSLVTALLAGFGRAAAEVGAVLIVGGNIDGFTRTMTTAIALETSKGDLPLAIGLGLVLIAIVVVVNAAAWGLRRAGERLAG